MARLVCWLIVVVLLATACDLPDAAPAAQTTTPAAAPAVTDTPPPFPTASDTPPAPTPPAPVETQPLAGETRIPRAPTTPAPAPGGGPGWQAGVLLAEGRCCVGGQVGTKVDLPVGFTATGPGGPALEMRYGYRNYCMKDAELALAGWRPFTSRLMLPLKISAVNWVGFYVSAQFRDAQGNVSEVVCDDISVEGSPAMSSQMP